jgi:putative endopeptidase
MLAERWKRAVAQVNVSIGDAVGRDYAARYFPPEAKAQIDAMVAGIKAAYALRIDRLDWMTADTKVKAKAKLANLKIEIGYPDHWRDYSGLNIARGDLYGDVQRANAFEYGRDLAKLGQPVDRTEWSFSTTPQTVNAFNTGPLIKLEFPAGFLAPPYFDPAADPAVNYGAIGTVIGHEISHSFDNTGAKTLALAAQYDAYEALPGLHLQGKLELGENVGDLGGLVVALDAYHASLGGRPAPVLDGLTADQRYFLSYAQAHRGTVRDDYLRQLVATDPHSPDRFRADDVRNLDAWYAAFDVKPGDKLFLTPEERVRIW